MQTVAKAPKYGAIKNRTKPMKKNIALLIIIIISFACKKPKVKSVNTNNSKDSLTYQPMVPESNWKYEMLLAGINKSTYNVTRLDKDSTINGLKYQVFNDEKQGLQFYRRDGDRYYSVVTAAANKTELLILDASKQIGESWVGGINGSDTYTYTIKGKYPSYQLDGFTFKNVIQVYQERKNGNNITLEGNTYYAQGVGNILTDGKVSGISVYIKLIEVNLK